MDVEVRQIHLCVIFVRASSVEIFLLMELVQNAILELEIHSLMIEFQSLSMKSKAFLIHLHNLITKYTFVSYVKAIPTIVMNVHNESCLFMSQNRATIKALVIMIIHMTLQVYCNHIRLTNCGAQRPSKNGDEHLDTISETELDEFIKSSVENLVPNPSESEDDSKCDMPAYDDFTTFFNLLFDADDDFSSIDDKSFFDEDISKEIYSNPLFDEEIISIKIDLHRFNAESDLIESLLNHDSLVISSSSKIDSLLDEFAGELILLKSIPPGIDEADCDPEEEIRLIKKLLYDNSSPRPLEEFNSENFDAIIECFSPFPILVEDSDSLMEEINLSFIPDDSMPPGIENDDYDSEGDILIREELLSSNSLSFPENESFHSIFHHPLALLRNH
uniref:Reverse transcriptase domain-containing protein n=1 Tax=Tanacetum cinerariifolium TaxID=118510 RepID=A0A699JYZ5_TANCI|nr:hypothetical protein [Tanacetum cinerariifolium]